MEKRHTDKYGDSAVELNKGKSSLKFKLDTYVLQDQSC